MFDALLPADIDCPWRDVSTGYLKDSWAISNDDIIYYRDENGAIPVVNERCNVDCTTLEITPDENNSHRGNYAIQFEVVQVMRYSVLSVT